MSYISFYRKWRPQTFSDVIGQDHVVQTLENAISKSRISHAYIFCGPRGTGKTSLARILAKALNCTNGPATEPCNRCDNCTSISAGTNVDVIEIDAASNRGINEIRELREKVKYLPAVLSKKVYIIDEVHMLTTEAFNALLKVLEEPPEHVIFILATTEPHQVLPTIMSRCQRFDFFPIPMDKIKRRLMDLSSIENITISDSAINLIAKYADGSLRDADGILEQLSSLGEDDVKVEDITSLLGVIDLEMMFELANILIEKNLSQALLFVHRVILSNLNLKIFVSEFIDHLYSLYVIKKYDNPFDILNIGEDFKDRYLSQSKLFSGEEIEPLIDLFSDLLKQVKWGENTKTFFKLTILKAVNYNFVDETRLDLKFNNINW
jgi:DNA polymerase III subunit gamma/tau